MSAFEAIVIALSARALQVVKATGRRVAKTLNNLHAWAGLALCICMLVAPPSAHASEAWRTDGQPVSAALNITIVIPAVLRVLENTHPLSLPPADTLTARTSVVQRMVLVSTLGKGFCMDLLLNRQQIADWQLSVSGSAGIWLEPAASGYRLCAARAGRYELALQHDFILKEKSREIARTAGAAGSAGLERLASAPDWPVNLSFATP